MSTTFTNEQVLKWIQQGTMTEGKRNIIYQEPYSDEVFIEGLKKHELSFYEIKNPSENVCLFHLHKYPWMFAFIENPTYPVMLEAVRLHPANLKKVPNAYRTEELVDLAIDSAIEIRQFKPRAEVCQVASIPKALRTEERLKRILQVDGKALKYLNHPQSLKKEDDQRIRQAIQATPRSVLDMDLMTLDEDYLVLALSLNGKLLKKIPQTRWTERVVKTALKRDGSVISFIKNPTYELLEFLVEHHPNSLDRTKGDIPLTLYKKALYHSPMNLRSEDAESLSIVPYQFQNTNKLKDYPFTISEQMGNSIPEIQKEVCFIGARYGGFLHSKMDLSSYFIALSSPIQKPLEKEISALTHSPFHHQLSCWIEKTFYDDNGLSPYEMDFRFKANERLKEIKQDGLKLRGVPLEKQSVKLVREAIKQNPNALKYADPNLKDYRLCRQAIKENPNVRCFSPYHVEDVVEQQLMDWRN